jgi:hypothetical protein
MAAMKAVSVSVSESVSVLVLALTVGRLGVHPGHQSCS